MILLSVGGCGCLGQRAGWYCCQEDVPTPWLERTCHEELFVPCPSKLTGKAVWCPWQVPVFAGVMQESHPLWALGDGWVTLAMPVLGDCVLTVGLAEVWEQQSQRVFISKISLAGSCGGVRNQWVQRAELFSEPGLLANLRRLAGVPGQNVCVQVAVTRMVINIIGSSRDRSWAVHLAVSSVGASCWGVGTTFALVFFAVTAASRWPVPRQGVFGLG